MQNSVKPAADVRRQALERWVAELWGQPSAESVPASADASFRRYFRFEREGDTQVAMDAPPPQEDCRPFVEIAALLKETGVHVPRVLAQDLDRGFLLLDDLGHHTYRHVLNPDNADGLFNDAIEALIRIQLASRPGVLPDYDEALLRRELELFPEWYLQRHLGWKLSDSLRARLDGIFQLLIDSALAQEKVFVHRDYMPRNLMLSEPNPGIIDFQDARYGPVSYDIISLFKDAFLSWPQEQVSAWLERYWERARAEAIPVPDSFEQFQRDCDWMGAQRHLKIMGIFARIYHRDGKPDYLADVARFDGYLGYVANKYPELAGLSELLEQMAADK